MRVTGDTLAARNSIFTPAMGRSRNIPRSTGPREQVGHLPTWGRVWQVPCRVGIEAIGGAPPSLGKRYGRIPPTRGYEQDTLLPRDDWQDAPLPGGYLCARGASPARIEAQVARPTCQSNTLALEGTNRDATSRRMRTQTWLRYPSAPSQ
jgi:hypothetical protein